MHLFAGGRYGFIGRITPRTPCDRLGAPSAPIDEFDGWSDSGADTKSYQPPESTERISLRSILIISGITFANFSAVFLIKLAVPLLLIHLGASLTFIGAAMAVHSIVIAGASVPFGSASDRLGRRLVAILGILLILGSSFLFVGVRDPMGTLLPLVLLALGLAAFEPTITTLVGDVAKPAEMGRAYGSFTAALQAGASFGPALAGSLIFLFGYDIPFMVASLLALVTLILMSLAFRKGLGARTPGERMSLRGNARSLIHNRIVTVGWVSTISSFTIIGGFETFFPVYAIRTGLEEWLIGL